MSGTVLLIAGPSGSGKTTLTRALVRRVPFLTRAITVTTRLPRPGEVSGEDYHFVSPEQFVEMNRSGALIECAETYTESYGILVDPTPETSIFDIGEIRYQLRTLLGVSVDVLTPQALHIRLRDQVIAEALPV